VLDDVCSTRKFIRDFIVSIFQQEISKIKGDNMKAYFLTLAVLFLLGGFLVLVKLISNHFRNKQIISPERMRNRELAEAIVGKKIDWNN